MALRFRWIGGTTWSDGRERAGHGSGANRHPSNDEGRNGWEHARNVPRIVSELTGLLDFVAAAACQIANVVRQCQNPVTNFRTRTKGGAVSEGPAAPPKEQEPRKTAVFLSENFYSNLLAPLEEKVERGSG